MVELHENWNAFMGVTACENHPGIATVIEGSSEATIRTSFVGLGKLDNCFLFPIA